MFSQLLLIPHVVEPSRVEREPPELQSGVQTSYTRVPCGGRTGNRTPIVLPSQGSAIPLGDAPMWCLMLDSNQRSLGYEPSALAN